MQTVPLQSVPSQSTRVVLGGQNCQISLNQKPQGLFFDLSVDGVAIVNNIIARDAVPLVCREYVGFTGNLLFVDTQGSADPDYTGLAAKFSLVYLTAEEYVLV